MLYVCHTGDKAGGCVRALYDPTLSERGVLLCAARKPRAKDPLDFEVCSLNLGTEACNAVCCKATDLSALCLRLLHQLLLNTDLLSVLRDAITVPHVLHPS